jgi:hypothetical protein
MGSVERGELACLCEGVGSALETESALGIFYAGRLGVFCAGGRSCAREGPVLGGSLGG